jgi:hypothetical protein
MKQLKPFLRFRFPVDINHTTMIINRKNISIIRKREQARLITTKLRLYYNFRDTIHDPSIPVSAWLDNILRMSQSTSKYPIFLDDLHLGTLLMMLGYFYQQIDNHADNDTG